MTTTTTTKTTKVYDAFNDAIRRVDADHIVDILQVAGVTWGAYVKITPESVKDQYKELLKVAIDESNGFKGSTWTEWGGLRVDITLPKGADSTTIPCVTLSVSLKSVDCYIKGWE